MNETLKALGEMKHSLREAQIKLLKDSKYIGGLVDMIEKLIEDHNGNTDTKQGSIPRT